MLLYRIVISGRMEEVFKGEMPMFGDFLLKMVKKCEIS